MSVLVDTSVWVAHFREKNEALINLMEMDRALVHPMVLGELACGTPPEPRQRTLGYIGLLRPSNQASLKEVMTFVEQERLYGRGCGLVDMMLLASTVITPEGRLWTLDKRLAGLADEFDVAYQPHMH
ncbi:VapC toxin family PIN domain ribonuclease [Alloalcanivorax xenomutans]|uniref:type II toxin-antitoxin system VapC family toxin n=1 Tax=Alloalcanivorax xenomutans TaxID=1094342 RepID=UPI0029341AC6|nr:PIN domain-containing protein [Alloalcanivorax xenomutans]WOD28656.1 VapC toxin family PIN domain ribonuclease [Alloalcanivorax xenomutans]